MSVRRILTDCLVCDTCNQEFALAYGQVHRPGRVDACPDCYRAGRWLDRDADRREEKEFQVGRLCSHGKHLNDCDTCLAMVITPQGIRQRRAAPDGTVAG